MSDPSKTSGQYNSSMGTAKEAAGNVIGSKDLQSSGQQQHTEGEAETTAAKAQGYVQGTIDRVGGYVDSVVGAVTGDKTQQTTGNVRNEKGQTQQEINK